MAARKLVDILRALPEADVQLSLANKKLSVASGKSRFNLQTLSAEEFPTVAQAEFTADFTLPAATLKYLLSMVHFAMAQQDIRYYLNGMLLVVDGTTVRAVATDGHRLALCEVQKDGAEREDRSHHPAQDDPRTGAAAAGQRRPGARADGRDAGEVHASARSS